MKKGEIYVPGAASKMGRPPLEVPTVRIQPRILPATLAVIEAHQKKWGCTAGQALDRLLAGF